MQTKCKLDELKNNCYSAAEDIENRKLRFADLSVKSDNARDISKKTDLILTDMFVEAYSDKPSVDNLKLRLDMMSDYLFELKKSLEGLYELSEIIYNKEVGEYVMLSKYTELDSLATLLESVTEKMDVVTDDISQNFFDEYGSTPISTKDSVFVLGAIKNNRVKMDIVRDYVVEIRKAVEKLKEVTDTIFDMLSKTEVTAND